MEYANEKDLEEINMFKERLTIALKAAKICVFEVDLLRQLYTFFENSEDIFGVPGDSILKDVQPFCTLSPIEYRLAVSNYFSHPDDASIISKAFSDILKGKPTTYQARMRAGGSNFIWCKIDATPVLQDNKPVKMIGVITDISRIKQQNDFLKEKATLDSFTGLYNKEYALDLMQDFLIQSQNQCHAFVLLDIDNFKNYNDTYGHYEGDRAIQSLASLIKKAFRNSDICGRFGGDEFIILIKNFPDTAWLRERIKPLLIFQNCGHSLSTSIGVAIYPQDATTFQRLFQNADKALYHSKIERKAFTLFAQLNEL
ncbi:MAG: sensor domain-containing diguanylate cyclase [Lachnospiraceae bacterium]|nr:sensor domain-containing diguanylate cyclase [Lachnospiraceae bacterium]